MLRVGIASLVAAAGLGLGGEYGDGMDLVGVHSASMSAPTVLFEGLGGGLCNWLGSLGRPIGLSSTGDCAPNDNWTFTSPPLFSSSSLTDVDESARLAVTVLVSCDVVELAGRGVELLAATVAAASFCPSIRALILSSAVIWACSLTGSGTSGLAGDRDAGGAL